MSVVTLYYSTSAQPWRLIPGELFKIDNIDNYLSNLPQAAINDFQYIRCTLEAEIKIDTSQAYAQPLAGVGIKYVSIQNSGERVYYYFVKHISQRAKSTIRLELVMDVLNTFNEGTDYNFKGNTRIIREHKDRLVIKTLGVNFEVSSVDSVVGSLSEDDEVQVYRYVSGAPQSIFRGIISLWDGDNILVRVNDGTALQDIRTALEGAVVYQDLLYIRKDANNYIEFYASDIIYNKGIYRNIDIVPENINPILHCGNGDGALIEKASPLNIDWYLLYRNQNDPDPASYVNPVDCYLIPAVEVNTNSAYIESGRLIPSFLEEGKYYFFQVTGGHNFTLSNGQVWSYDSNYYSRVLITKAGDKISAILIKYEGVYGTSVVYAQYDDLQYITIQNLPVNYYVTNTLQPLTYAYMSAMTFPEVFNNSGSYSTLDSFDKVDRTDAKNIKFIKIPYCPYNFSVSGSVLQTAGDSNWEFVALSQVNGGTIYCLKLKDLNTKLQSTINNLSHHPISDLAILMGINPTTNDLRTFGGYLESKLFHSEFYQPTYVYDSFSFKVELEKCDLDFYVLNYQSFNITFNMTKTINSKFMFTFDEYKLKYASENYAKYLPIARNNEEVLYNVPYVNYIRTGLNYDVKSKALGTASGWVGVGLSGLSTLTSLALPSVPLKVAGVVGSLVSMAISVKGVITSSIQGEDMINQKLLQAKNQAASVMGSDDVDLMSEYAHNRLKYLVYIPTPRMKSMLENLFFYAGYNSGRMGIPNHNTRVNFDYLECEAVFEDTGANLPEDIVEELRNCFKVGVTYIHRTNRTNDKWDIEQKFENWEVSLLED